MFFQSIFNAKNIIRNPIGNERLAFITKDGKVSRNVGCFYVSRHKINGRFVKRSLIQKIMARVA